ncbi:MAG: formimidoylglutamase [Flavobacterium sp.]|nr:formimidoylglutamase [Flavobacterium sp.]
MAFNFLKPINSDILDFAFDLSTQHLASKIVYHTKVDFPDLKKIKIAIVGVIENRGDSNKVNNVNLDFIRKEFYSLFPGNWNTSIADLGDLDAGDKIEDTYFALHKVVSFLLKKNIIPIIIGGTQDLTYSIYRAYDTLEQMVNLVVIDNKFDLGKEEDDLSRNSYLTKIIVDEPNNLNNFSNVGYQSYFSSQEEIDLIEKLYFDKYRLGEVCNKIEISEPVFRDADLVSLDMNAIKSSDSGNIQNFMPNGFNGKEICALSRYAGISDKVSCFGIFNHNNSIQESILIAQIMWYFIEGYHYRSNEYPFSCKDNYIKYIVPVDDHEIIFYRSDKTERWWMEITIFDNINNKLKKQTLLPCSHDEYLATCNQEIPERWWKSQKKNLIF